MKFLFLFIFVLGQAWGHERSVHSKADKFATSLFSTRQSHPWPFPLLSIGHNMQSYQNYSNSPYWHDGLDIRAREDQPVYAAVGGKVVNIENYNSGPLYWEVAILDADGFVWKYHHVAKDSITAEIKEAFKSGKPIADGTLIGNVVKWPVTTFGEVYHHLHLLIVGADRKYINPFLMLEPLNDNQAPVITSIGLARNHRQLSGWEVKGPHSLYVEASDLTLHQKFILPPYKLSYSLDKGPNQLVWEFINLPSGTNDEAYIDDFYLEGTCGNYSCRKFLFNLNFTLANPRGTISLEPGRHEVEVTVEDIVGNKTSKTFSWNVL